MKNEVSSQKRKYVIVFLVIVVGLLLYVFLNSDVFDHSYKDRLRAFSDGWKSETGVTGNISGIRTGDYGGSVHLTKRLPESLSEADAICFESYNVDIEVFIDGQLIYSFKARENFTGRGYGYAFHTAHLSEEDGGRILYVNYNCVDPGGARGLIREVYIGSGVDYVHMGVLNRSLSAVLSIMIAIFGIMLMIIYLWIPDKKRLPCDIASLGLAAFLLGLWLFTDSNIMALLSGHIYVLRALNRISVILVPFPLVSFLSSLTRTDRRIYRTIAFWTNIMYVGLFFVLRFAVGIDMIVFFFRSLFAYAVFIALLIIILFIDNRIYCHSKGIDLNLRYFFVAVAGFIICALVDIIGYTLRLSVGDSYGTFTRIGILIILVGFTNGFLNWWIKDQAEIERDRLVNRILKYSISGNSPDESIRAMMDVVGNQLKAQRVVVIEDTGHGKLHGTYAWYEEHRKPGSIDLLYIPYEGFADKLLRTPGVDEHCIIINNVNDYKTANPALYNLLVTNGISSLAASSLELNGRLIGIYAVLDPPQDKLAESAEVIRLISYFVSQLILRRDEEKRLRFYSYNDTLSGALNRMAYREYIESGLDTTSAFGYLVCEIGGLERANDIRGLDVGDKMVIDLVNSLMDVFGNGNVYRISGTEFAAFGFESEEAFFYNDVDRVKKMAGDKGLSVFMGSVYCLYGTLDISMVISRANELLKEDKEHVNL